MRILLSTFITLLIFSYLLDVANPLLWTKLGTNAALFLSELRIEWGVMNDALFAVYETLVISLFGVSGGVLLAYLLAPLASPLIMPPAAAAAFRTLANFVRSVPAVVWAIFFVILAGPGPRAGALALVIYTSIYLIKFFYETLEAVDRELYNSLKVMGLSGLPLAFALYTHAKRHIVTQILFMLEYNVRTATILGLVGAGGVGYYIAHYLSLLNYSAVMTFVIATLALVITIDLVSYAVRRII